MLIGLRRSGAIAIALLSCLSLVLLLASGCGGEGEKEEAPELSVDEMWSRAQEAGEEINSWHMEIASYYQDTQFGSGQIQSIIIDVNGDDIHEQDLLLGQVYAEFIRVDGKQYNRDMMSEQWTEVPEASTESTAEEYTSRFMELPSEAATQEHLGSETVNERETEHFRFTLDSQAVLQMFATEPSFDFSENTGAEVDAWIDVSRYYLVRYELVIHDVIIPEQIGKGDIRFVVNINDINEPIDIAAPI